MKKIVLLLVLSFYAFAMNAQTKVTGKVFDEYLEPFVGAIIKSDNNQTVSDENGNFTLNVSENIPFTIQVLSLGYQTETIEVNNNDELNVILKENSLLDEVVVSASRTPERIFESPVTVERFSLKGVKNSSTQSFYDAIANLKGVDINVNSSIVKTLNTRGFTSFENTRFVQLIDGVDNAYTSAGYTIGNSAGLSPLDIESVEVLPGAASALYGANAFNGLLIMNSKNPFNHTGLSTYYQTGITSQKAAGNNQFNNLAIRFAHAFGDKFAFKTNFRYYKGEEWHSNDSRNTSGVGGVILPGDRDSNLAYDGVNVYGDEVKVNIRQAAQAAITADDFDIPPGLTEQDILDNIPNQVVSRTGYLESDFVDYSVDNLNLDVALHYRPMGNENLEIIWASKFATGSPHTQGTNRYIQDNSYLDQHRLEFKGKNFFVRGYKTFTDIGNSYDSRLAGLNINRQWKEDEDWFGDYIERYLITFLSDPNRNVNNAHAAARLFANSGRFVPGTDEFSNAFANVRSKLNLQGGAKFVNKSDLYHIDYNYNFRDLIDWAEIQLGGSYRDFSLTTNGTILTDYDGTPIEYDEYGFYSQIQKKFMDNRLKFTGSVRYDKSKNFVGNFSPRVSFVYTGGENRNHSIRASYQTAFRNPTPQQQYNGTIISSNRGLVGTAKDNLDRYFIDVLVKGGNQGAPADIGSSVRVTGTDAFNNGVSIPSLEEFDAGFRASLAGGATPEEATINNLSKIKKRDISLIRAEEVKSYEIGYRGGLNIFNSLIEVDLDVYYNDYNGFITRKDVLVPLYGGGFDEQGIVADPGLFLTAIRNFDVATFDMYTNSESDVFSYGLDFGLNTKIFKDFSLGMSYSLARFNADTTVDPDFVVGFNTPEHKAKVSFGNPKLFRNFGFNVNARWQDSFYWESEFLSDTIDARTEIDAQINYTIPAIKSRFKIGGTNLLGKEFITAPGIGGIGSVYYISWTLND